MQQNLVEQLRDIHQPAVPADDSLQLMLILAVLIVASLSLLYSIWRLYRPVRPAWQRRAIDELENARQSADSDSLANAAMTLRRAVAHMGATSDMSKSSGSRYLHQLDELFDCDFFTAGSGAIFGNPLYQQTVSSSEVDNAINGVSELLQQHRT